MSFKPLVFPNVYPKEIQYLCFDNTEKRLAALEKLGYKAQINRSTKVVGLVADKDTTGVYLVAGDQQSYALAHVEDINDIIDSLLLSKKQRLMAYIKEIR
jgi:hypothetical protein